MRLSAVSQGLLFLLLTSTVLPEVALAGKLDRAGAKARSSSSSSSSHSSRHGSTSSDGGELDPFSTIVFFGYGLYYTAWLVSSPFWGPYRAMESDNPTGTTRDMRYADYPYAQGAGGHLLYPEPVVYGWDGVARSKGIDRAEPRLLQRSSVQLGAEAGVGLRDAVLRVGVHARLQLPMRLEFDTEWSMLREHDREGVDTAYLGREHLAVRFAQSSRLQFHAGVGPQHFCDAIGCVHGVDFTYGLEAFPGRPIVLSAEGSLGNLGSAFAPGVRTRIGYLIGEVEASLGWHQRWVGGVPLGGPFLGIGGWF
jgi:hypothetical protein